jgi:RNA polymerase sigma-70 factor (ECF subfamily)
MTDRYTEFYTDYRDKLFSYLMRMSGDYEVSRDIMQESFTRHYQHYGDNPAIVPSALFTIARNALIDYWRRNGRTQSLDYDPPAPKFTIDMERALIVKEELQNVMEALKELPEDDREILSMAVSGLGYKHIADVMGLSEANVKIKIHRTRLKLHQIMSKGEN